MKTVFAKPEALNDAIPFVAGRWPLRRTAQSQQRSAADAAEAWPSPEKSDSVEDSIDDSTVEE